MIRTAASLACSIFLVSCAAPQTRPVGPRAALDPKPIEFFEDDAAGAAAEARATHRPMFVDVWAPWCHTCLSMREYVFPDRRVRALGDRFVWLAIDTEKPQNAAFLAAHPMEVWPTFWVLDAASGAPRLRWNGSATASELVSLLEDAETGIAKADASGEAGANYLRGNKATAAGRSDEAIVAYRAALAAAPIGWARRAHVVEALSTRLWAKEDWAACVSFSATELPRMPPGTPRKSVAYNGLACAESLPKDTVLRAETDAIVKEAERIVTDGGDPILADDRSDLYEELVGALKIAGNAAKARHIAMAWAAFLEHEASRAPTAAARAVFDSHRLDASLELDDPAAAIPVLAKSEREFPRDYNPPARLASAYLALKDYDHALAAIDRGLAHVYGPRTLRLLSIKATILAAKGDLAGEKATLSEAVALARSLTLTGSQLRLRAALEKRLAERAPK